MSWLCATDNNQSTNRPSLKRRKKPPSYLRHINSDSSIVLWGWATPSRPSLVSFVRFGKIFKQTPLLHSLLLLFSIAFLGLSLCLKFQKHCGLSKDLVESHFNILLTQVLSLSFSKSLFFFCLVLFPFFLLISLLKDFGGHRLHLGLGFIIYSLWNVESSLKLGFLVSSFVFFCLAISVKETSVEDAADTANDSDDAFVSTHKHNHRADSEGIAFEISLSSSHVCRESCWMSLLENLWCNNCVFLWYEAHKC